MANKAAASAASCANAASSKSSSTEQLLERAIDAHRRASLIEWIAAQPVP
jgi:hypothetical protein